jgi:hypothetical protein
MPIIEQAKAAILAGLCLACFAGGYWLRDMMAEAEKSVALRQAVNRVEKQAETAVRVETVYLEAEAKTRTVYKTIIKEVPKYVPIIQASDSACNLSRGTVRLLNNAIADQLPKSATGADEADQAASDVREADLINHSQESIDQYNQTMNQCNALMDWVKETSHAGQ